jgi:hypothetical protein
MHRRNVDYASEAALGHFRQSVSHCVKRTGQIYRDNVVPDLSRRFGEADGMLDARIVYQDVRPALVGNVCHHSLYRRRIAHVGVEEARIGSPAISYGVNGRGTLPRCREPVYRNPRTG